jgi:cell division protein FtsI (penicillin-binding protein 3)
VSGRRRSAVAESSVRRTHRVRLWGLVLAFVVVASACAARLVQLQVLEGDRWRTLATSQNAAEQEIPATRGSLRDRSGRLLAVDGHEFQAFLAPRELLDHARAVTTLDGVLGLTSAERSRLLGKKSGWVGVPRRISGADRQRLEETIPRGLYFQRLPSRVYPEGALARSLLGALNRDGLGVSGLELELDSLLRGEPGTALARQDAIGNTYWLPDGELAAARPGHDVLLTIDLELQTIAERELDNAMASSGASGGDILLLDPRTGELLAAASRRNEGYRRVPAFTDPYEPGSTLKPFLLASLLADEAAGLDEKIDLENGEFRDGRRLIRDVHRYDSLTVADVVSHSSNVGAVKLARRLTPGQQYRYLRDFGFGVLTGIEHPAESEGLLRRPDQWSALSQASLAMGYEIAVTSLQLAAAYAALANEGILMRPRLVKEVRDPSGRAVYEQQPEQIRRVVSADVARQVAGVLTSVVNEGTGTRAAMAQLAMAGKTGTARLLTDGRYEPRYTASFVGFAPADDPRLVILTRLEDPQGSYYGGSVAAPVTQRTLEAALASRGIIIDRHLDVTPVVPASWGARARPTRDTGPFVFAVGDSPAPWPVERADESAERTLPDLRGLPIRSAVARLHELGLHVELRAEGRVRRHDPPPGRRIERGGTVVLR